MAWLRLFWNLLQGLARGLALPLLRPKTQRLGHEVIVAKASYSPWLRDKEFRSLHRPLKSHTLVDEFRCYELWYLLKQLDIPGDVLEVGTWRGGTGLLMAACERHMQRSTTVYLADTFKGVVKAGVRDSYYAGGEHADATEQDVKDKASELRLSNFSLLKGVFPDDTGDQVSERRFKLCHIDVDVYDSARGVFEWVWPRLEPGGLVIFDDYGFPGCNGITELVEELKEESGRLAFHNLNGHAIIIKQTGSEG